MTHSTVCDHSVCLNVVVCDFTLALLSELTAVCVCVYRLSVVSQLDG